MSISKIFEIITYVSFGILLIIFLIIGIRYLIIKIIENQRNKKGGTNEIYDEAIDVKQTEYELADIERTKEKVSEKP